MTATAPGFSALERRVTVAVGSKVGIDLHLEVGKTETTVEVSESAVQVDTTSQTLREVVTENQLRELPNLTRTGYPLDSAHPNL